MNFRMLVIPVGGALLLLALFLGLPARGGAASPPQAAQATPTATVQAANTPAVTRSPTATTRATVTATAGAARTPTTEVTEAATPTATVGTGPVITLTATGEVDTARTITVIGEGRVDAQPDQAQVTIGVETSDTSVQNAVDENNQRMQAVIDALADQGVSRANIQTSNYSIFTETPPGGPEVQAGEEVTPTLRYRVTQQVNVLITDLDTVSDVLDAAVSAGANNIFGVNFTVGETDQLESQARRLAMEDALRNAEETAALANVELAGVVSISEIIPGPGPLLPAAAREGLGGGGPPIQPGQFTFTKQLQITFGIR